MIATSNKYKSLHGEAIKEIPVVDAVDAYNAAKEEPEHDDLPF